MRSRLLLLAAGAVTGFLLVAGAAAFWPSEVSAKAHRHVKKCISYFLIPQLRICGNKVFLVAHGRRMYVGRTRDLLPMPAPPQRRR